MERRRKARRNRQQAAALPRVRRHWRHAFPPVALLLGGDLALDNSAFGPAWNERQLAQLHNWAQAAPDDALPAPDGSALTDAQRAGHPLAVNRAASELALKLARLHLLGSAPQSQRAAWHVPDTDSSQDLSADLSAAVSSDRLDAFFAGLRPAQPAYAGLRTAFAEESDPKRRLAIARTMERWRWLPRDLGPDFVLANPAGFEVNLWRGRAHVKRWPAISGKPASPTPSLRADIVAVNFNPWWEVPMSIARESNMRAGLKYQWNGTRFRQPPGPANALGQMKLLMPNPYNIYLHDTPSRGLFAVDDRAFSHGCIRVGDALDFAATLLEGVRTRAQIDRIVNPAAVAGAPKAEPKSTVVSLPHKLPVYVLYMTVTVRPDGTLAFHKDIYGRDAKIAMNLPEPPVAAAASYSPQ